MDTRVKNALGIGIIIIMLVFAVAAMKYVSAYSKSIQPTSFRSFSVSAEGKVFAKPDVAQFTFSVISEGDKDIGALQTDNAEKAQKAIDFVKSKGVDPKDIRTSGYNVTPRYEQYNCYPTLGALTVKPCPPAKIVGYTITQTVEVKVRDFKNTGTIVSGIVTAGANDVSQLSFTIDDPSAVQNEARAQAIEKAKAKAESLAKAGGFHVGILLGIEEGAGQYPIYSRMETFGAADSSAPKAAPVPIEPGSQEVNLTVTLKYEID